MKISINVSLRIGLSRKPYLFSTINFEYNLKNYANSLHNPDIHAVPIKYNFNRLHNPYSSVYLLNIYIFVYLLERVCTLF